MITKRVFDLCIAAFALLLLVPFFVYIAIWIKIDSPGSIVFRQIRVGQFGKYFRIAKFRTMAIDASSKGSVITAGGDSRVTKAGRWLRKFKIDELPQLWNVFIGDMSFVGPRPEVPKFVRLFKQDYEEILKVKPGITDYATILYRDEETVLARYADPETGYINEVLPAKIQLYKQYIRERGFIVDLSVIFRTLYAIVK